MKRKLTAEQAAARDARRAKFRALAKRVADMTPEQQAELARGCVPLSIDGRSYSMKNTMLLALQLPTCTILGGFRQWLKAGRCVRKGEHGATIWCKAGGRKLDAAADAAAEENETRFVMGTVFDVAQTDELKPGARTVGNTVLPDEENEPDAVTLPAVVGGWICAPTADEQEQPAEVDQEQETLTLTA